MVDDQMTPEQMAELQKKNCIFCKIVAGEVESKKVFENDHFLGILDIRPAIAGHVLLLPKDHVPILPLLPEEKLIEYFQLAVEVGHAVREAMIAQKVTILAASGYAAGQQAPHAMLHIIPREKGDGLDMLDLEALSVDQPDAVALSGLFAQATTQALAHRKRGDLVQKSAPKPVTTPAMADVPTMAKENVGATTAAPSTPEAPRPEENQFEPSAGTQEHDVPQPEEAPTEEEYENPTEALQSAIAMNPDLRRLIIAQPDLVADYVKKSPKLSALFKGVNIRALSLMLQRQEREKPLAKTAAQMTDQELFSFIDGNEGLRTWLLEHPEELAMQISKNQRLQQFFANVDILELGRKYKAHKGGT